MSEGGYVRSGAVLPYCKGCGHAAVLRALDGALSTLAVPPSDVAIVSDIGCVGLVDGLIDRPHTIHTTHGRSVAFATGIALADAGLGEHRLKTIVMIGDGGSMIGLNHLVFASVVNVDLTVLVHNNFLFGMTGGQQSSFSPVGFVTATTKGGNPVPPLDLARVLLASRASFVARKFATDRDLAETIARAVAHPGFSTVEILELCTAYGTRWNALTGARMKEVAEEAGYEVGVLRDEPRPSPSGTSGDRVPPRPASPPAGRFSTALDRRYAIVLAGTAGERVQTAASLLAEAGMMSGLHVTQKNDNPVTQGTGFSVSEVILSPEAILYTGIVRPDVVFVTSDDGAQELARSGLWSRIDPGTLVLADARVALPDLACDVRRLPLRERAGPKLAATTAVGLWLRESRAVSPAAFEEALERRLGGSAAGEARAALDAWTSGCA